MCDSEPHDAVIPSVSTAKRLREANDALDALLSGSSSESWFLEKYHVFLRAFFLASVFGAVGVLFSEVDSKLHFVLSFIFKWAGIITLFLIFLGGSLGRKDRTYGR